MAERPFVLPPVSGEPVMPDNPSRSALVESIRRSNDSMHRTASEMRGTVMSTLEAIEVSRALIDKAERLLERKHGASVGDLNGAA